MIAMVITELADDILVMYAGRAVERVRGMDMSTRHTLSLLMTGGGTEYNGLRKEGGTYGDD